MATVENNLAQALVPGVESLLRIAVAEATEKVIYAAKERFEQELRTAIAKNAIDIGRFVEMSRDRNVLMIQIKDERK